MNSTHSKTYHLKKNQFFHNRGWIATNFKVKTSNISKAKLKKKQLQKCQPSRDNQNALFPIHYRYIEHSKILKPTTASLKSQKIENFGTSQDFNPLITQFQAKAHNFKTTISNKKQLLFMRPYTSKNKSMTMTINEKKSEVYQQINNPDVLLLSDYFNKTGVIEYLTQYKQPYEIKKDKQKIRPKTCSKNCINVLKQKLKNKCGLSSYQSKMRGLKYE